MNPILIQFFKAAVPGAPASKHPDALRNRALKSGYIIHPDLLNTDLEAFISTQSIDVNSTFYKRWKDVLDRDRFQLFIDQVMHYASTYGTLYTQEGNGYVPNDGAEAPDFSEYTMIVPITQEELYRRCLAVVDSGAALKVETVRALCGPVAEHVAAHPDEPFDLFALRNREAVSILCESLGVRPEEPVALLRYILYRTTGQTLLIQSDAMLGKVRANADKFDFHELTQQELDALASIFYRFKDLFLAFRTVEEYDQKRNAFVLRPSVSRPVINRIRRAAPKRHVPMQAGFWESLLAGEVGEQELRARLDGIGNFKLVTLLQAVRERLLLRPGDTQMYLIRNGSTWFREAPEREPDRDYLYMLERVLRERLVRNLAPKACRVRFPEGGLRLTCPASEKNFLGNLPFGSSYPVSDHNFFGIYWRGAWGTEDFDLSFVDWSGAKTGWNAEYNTGQTLYSGDMTSANPEASEVIYCKESLPAGSIYVNRYNGAPGSRFRFFFGQQDIVNLTENYMVDPNALHISEELVSDRREKMVGVVCLGRIWLMDLGVGEGRVSDGEDAGRKEAVIARKAQCFLPLREVLLEAGFTESDEPELDLRELKKDTLLSLFA